MVSNTDLENSIRAKFKVSPTYYSLYLPSFRFLLILELILLNAIFFRFFQLDWGCLGEFLKTLSESHEYKHHAINDWSWWNFAENIVFLVANFLAIALTFDNEQPNLSDLRVCNSCLEQEESNLTGIPHKYTDYKCNICNQSCSFTEYKYSVKIDKDSILAYQIRNKSFIPTFGVLSFAFKQYLKHRTKVNCTKHLDSLKKNPTKFLLKEANNKKIYVLSELESMRKACKTKGREVDVQLEVLQEVYNRVKTSTSDYINNPTRLDLCKEGIAELRKRKLILIKEIENLNIAERAYNSETEEFEEACRANLDLIEIMNTQRLIKEVDFLIADLRQGFETLSARHNLVLEKFRESNQEILAEIPARQEILNLS